MMASSKSFAFATEGMPTADLARGVLLRWRTERPTAPRPGSRFSTPSSCRIRRRGWRRCARVRWMCWDRAGHQLPASERHRRMSRQERNPCGGYLASPITCSITASTWGPSARPQYLERRSERTRCQAIRRGRTGVRARATARGCVDGQRRMAQCGTIAIRRCRGAGQPRRRWPEGRMNRRHGGDDGGLSLRMGRPESVVQ